MVTARRAVVVDDHLIVSEALAAALLREQVFETVDTAVSLADAGKIVGSSGCDLIILDLHLTDSDGRATVLAMRERFPEIPLLIFTGDGSLEHITMAFECGARGFVTKSSEVSVVIGAIRLILAGGSFIPPEAAKILGIAAPTAGRPRAEPRRPIFSTRQEQVFKLMAQGMPNKVIAARLDVAEGTAKAHLNAVYRVLGVRTRVEAILKARELGLL